MTGRTMAWLEISSITIRSAFLFMNIASIMKDNKKWPGLTLTQRLLYVVAPPGWSHDGSRLTSHDIKRAAGVFDEKPTRAPAE